MLDRQTSDIVLIVDDVPDNLAVLHDALDEAGYTVLVATNGADAIARAAQAQPHVVLLDALMPGIDGFEVARRLKAEAGTAHIPIVFMTGLTETEHVVAAFAAGGCDYVTKPIRAREVIARIGVHLHNAREQRLARNALDAFGHASLVVRLQDGRILWQTALARQLLAVDAATATAAVAAAQGQSESESVAVTVEPRRAPVPLLAWLQRETARVLAAQAAGVLPPPVPALELELGARRLRVSLQEASGDDEWLLVLREADDAGIVEALVLAFRLTQREAEVLVWLAKGKTNRDIGEILGSSPATVKKHLERVYEKLGVETRNAAVSVAIGRVRQLAAGSSG